MRDATGAEVESLFEGDDRLRWLVDELGISESLAARFPPDLPTPPPPAG